MYFSEIEVSPLHLDSIFDFNYRTCLTAIDIEPMVNNLPAAYPELDFKNIDIADISARVTYDIGSGTTKIMGALWNGNANKIEAVFAQYSFPMGYSYDLAHSSDNNFSDLIMEMGLGALKDYQQKIHTDLSDLNLDLKLEEYGVATEAFRKANNGEFFCNKIAETLNIDVKVISQDEEGKLGYYGALMAQKIENPVDLSPVVWDIGGGSLQMTHQNEPGEFTVLKGNLASSTFQVTLAEHLNSTALNKFEEALTVANQYLIFEESTVNKIKSYLEKGSETFGIGAVHNFSVQSIVNEINNETKFFYTKTEVRAAAEVFSKLDEAEIKKILHLDDAFVKFQFSNLMLVYTLMEKFKIEKVQTVKANNNQGLIMKGRV